MSCSCDMSSREFILGENKYVDFQVRSTRKQTVVIASATWKLTDARHNTVLSGNCVIDDDVVSALVCPTARGKYILEVCYEISDETRIARVGVEVI